MLLVIRIRDLAVRGWWVCFVFLFSPIKSTLIELASIIGEGTDVEPFEKLGEIHSLCIDMKCVHMYFCLPSSSSGCEEART